MDVLLRIFFPSLAPVYAAGKRYTKQRAQRDIRAFWLTLWVFGLFYLILLNVAAYTENDYWKGSWLFLAILMALPHSFAIFRKVFVPAEALRIIFRAARRDNQELIASIPKDVEQVLRYLSAVFAAELVCVLIVYWIPFYAIPEKIPVFDLAALALTAWACWTATGKWWENVVKYVSVGSFVAILLSFFIALSPWATGYVRSVKGWWMEEPQQVGTGNQGQQNQQQAVAVLSDLLRDKTLAELPVICPTNELAWLEPGKEVRFRINLDTCKLGGVMVSIGGDMKRTWFFENLPPMSEVVKEGAPETVRPPAWPIAVSLASLDKRVAFRPY